MAAQTKNPLKSARVLVHFDHLTGVIINANHSILKARCVAIHRGSTGTSVALIIAKTASPFLRFIRFTKPVVMIEVTGRGRGTREATADESARYRFLAKCSLRH